MVDPKSIVESELYNKVWGPMSCELKEGSRETSLVKFASKCSFLANDEKEAYPPSAKWEVFLNAQNITLRNHELADTNGYPANVTMRHWDFVQQVVMRGVPMKGAFIDTPIVFFKTFADSFYSLEVEGSALHLAIREGLEKGFDKRIKTLKQGTVYRVLNRELSVLKPQVIVINSNEPDLDILELMYVGKGFFLQNNLSLLVRSSDFRRFDEEKFFKFGGKIILQEPQYNSFCNHSDIHLFKDMITGKYWYSISKGYGYFPFEKLYVYDRWEGEDIELEKANAFVQGEFSSQLNRLCEVSKNVYEKYQTFERYSKAVDYESDECLDRMIPMRVQLPIIHKDKSETAIATKKEEVTAIFKEALARNSCVLECPEEIGFADN